MKIKVKPSLFTSSGGLATFAEDDEEEYNEMGTTAAPTTQAPSTAGQGGTGGTGVEVEETRPPSVPQSSAPPPTNVDYAELFGDNNLGAEKMDESNYKLIPRGNDSVAGSLKGGSVAGD